MKTNNWTLLFLAFFYFSSSFELALASNCGFDTTVTISNGMLTVGEEGASYQWIQCMNYTPMGDGNSQSYAPSDAWGYAVIITKNGCTDTSFCNVINSDALAGNCNFDTTLSLSGGVLSTSVSGASYQWIFCSAGNYAINNATSQSYNSIFGGEYAVIITQNGCSDTSQCISNQSIAAGGCNINPQISNPDGALICNVPNAIYQWINCGTGVPVAAATGEVFMPIISGAYAVAVTINNCTDTSSCLAWETPTSTGLRTINDNRNISLYPNPVEDMLYLDFQEPTANDVIEIKDVLGKLYLSQKLNRQVSATISTHHFPSGTYFVIVKSGNKNYIAQRFIKL